jgi:hypothetical protein
MNWMSDTATPNRVLEVISHLPEPNALLLAIASFPFGNSSANYSAMLTCKKSGDIEIFGEFGLPKSVRTELEGLTLWTTHPVGNVMRSGENFSHLGQTARTTESDSCTSMAPIVFQGVTRGCLLVNHGNGQPVIDVMPQIVFIATSLALYLQITTTSKSSTTLNPDRQALSSAAHQTELSAR